MKTIHIKNMVCDRCITSVKRTFNEQNIFPIRIDLGAVQIDKPIPPKQMKMIAESLQGNGFELIDSQTPILITQIKSELIKHFSQKQIPEDFMLSEYLTTRFPFDYAHMSRVFSGHEKSTLEHYVINLRIEKAKEFLAYNDLSISEVAYQLGYKSAAHFSRQFKKVVGSSPSEYRSHPSKRKSLQNI